MKCLEEKDIEKIVLENISVQGVIQEHLYFCNRCREIYLTFENLYRSYRLQSDNIEKDVNDLSRPTILLKPIKSSIPLSQLRFKLAAQDAIKSQKWKIASFSHKEQAIVGRIMQDANTGKSTLYLISTDIRKIRNQKVTLFGANFVGITDEHGQWHIGTLDLQAITGVQVESPRAVFLLKDHFTAKSRSTESHSSTLTNKNHDKIVMDIKPHGQSISWQIVVEKLNTAKDKKIQVIAVTDSGRQLIGDAQRGVTILETDKKERVLKIFIC